MLTHRPSTPTTRSGSQRLPSKLWCKSPEISNGRMRGEAFSENNPRGLATTASQSTRVHRRRWPREDLTCLSTGSYSMPARKPKVASQGWRAHQVKYHRRAGARKHRRIRNIRGLLHGRRATGQGQLRNHHMSEGWHLLAKSRPSPSPRQSPSEGSLPLRYRTVRFSAEGFVHLRGKCLRT